MKVEGLKGVIWKTQNTYEVHKVQKAHFEEKKKYYITTVFSVFFSGMML